MNPTTIDRRTRYDHEVVDLTPEQFFAEQLPAMLERHGHLAAAGFDALGARPLAIEVGDFCRTLTSDGRTMWSVDGAVEGSVIVTFAPEQFSDWAQQVRTFNSMVMLNELSVRGGRRRDLPIWDSLWIAVLEGWPVVDADLRFVDRNGDPLDLNRCFRPEDDPRDVAHFLRQAGYAHLRGWLDPAEMAEVAEDMDRACPLYHDGDDRSWWATLADGTRRCVRMQQFVEHSPTTAEFLSSDRWDNLRRTIAGDDPLVRRPVERGVIEALFKPLGVVHGVSDIPWHRDCNFGRHAYGCSGTTVGVSVTPGTETSGLLRAVAGSHRLAMPPEMATSKSYLPIVALPTETADVTVHLGCTIHEAMPPLTDERKVMYTGFGLAPRPEDKPHRPRDFGELRRRAAKETSQPPSPLAAQS